MIVPGIMLGIMCGVMVFIPPKGTPVELKSEKPKEVRTTVEFIVPDDPQSHRYQIGDIDWKRIKK